MLEAEGVATLVIDVTSSDRLFRGWRAGARARLRRSARRRRDDHHLTSLLEPSERRVPIVTVHDAASHHLAWLGGVYGARTVPVGVDRFGQSGTIADLYEIFGLLPEQIVNAGLVALN